MRLSLFLFLFVCNKMFGASFIGEKNGPSLNILASEVELPPNYSKSLKSGFSNILIFQLSVWKDRRKIGGKEITLKAVFDLWDEKYLVKRFVDGKEQEEKIGNDIDIVQKLKTQLFPSVIPIAEANNKLEISIKIIADPISKEKQKKIRAWLAENRVNVPVLQRESNQGNPSKSQSRQTSSAIETVKASVFNQVLDSELSSDSIDGSWVYESDKIKLVSRDTKDAK